MSFNRTALDNILPHPPRQNLQHSGASQHPAQAQAVPFLETLLAGVPDDQFLEIRTIDKNHSSRKKFHSIGTLRKDGIGSALPYYLDGKANIYYGVCARYEKLEAKNNDDRGDAVNLATALWFDEITRVPPPDLPPFSWTVETSIGKVQGGYFLDQPTADLARVEQLNKRLAAAVGGDNVFNRGRILRPPGFINAKYEGQQRSWLVEFHPDRRYSLEELGRLLPPLPGQAPGHDDDETPHRAYNGTFTPHYGDPLPEDLQAQLLDFLKGLGLKRYYDERYRGPCPFRHQDGPSDGEYAFYCSPITGFWHCFGSGHVGTRNGGAAALRSIGFRASIPQYAPPEGNASINLLQAKRGRPPEELQSQEPTEENCHHYQGYVDECWAIHSARRKNALRDGKPDRLTGEFRRHWGYLGANTRSENNAEKDHIYLSNSYVVKLCISMENPTLATQDLEPLLIGVVGEKTRDGEIHPAVKQLRECGKSCKWVCSDHGEKMRGQVDCRLHYCPNCLTDIARDLDRGRLPDLDHESGEAYRSDWLIGRYPLPSDLSEWETSLKELQRTWESEIVKIQRRKATKGSVLWRSFTAYYTNDEALIHWKVMFKEEHPGGADEAVTQLCEAMGADVLDFRRYVHGELASFQLIANAQTHLLGFSKDMDWDTKLSLFAAHYKSTRGRHVFQGMGCLWQILKELPEPEPLVCDECGARLRQVLINDDEPATDLVVGNAVYGHGPPDATTPLWTGAA